MKDKLRLLAEKIFDNKKIEIPDFESKSIKELIEELSIYHIELEHQNEELKISQQKLNKSNNRYTELFNTAPVGYLIISKDKIIVNANQTAADLLKTTTGSLISSKFSKLVHPEYQDIFYFHFQKTIKNKHHECVIKLVFPDKESIFVKLISQIDDYENKDIIRTAIININNEKELEIKLREEKKRAEQSDRFKSIFIANMNHEIRTPLNAIIGFSSLLERTNISKDKINHYTRIIKNSGNQLLSIIEDIMDIAKIESQQIEFKESVFYLNEFMLEIYSAFANKAKNKNIALYLEKALPDNKSKIKTDRQLLLKILKNLLDNAIKFTNKGYIEFGYTLKTKNSSQYIEIYVKDTGIGINKEDAEKIFDRFIQANNNLTREYGGLGLGLALVKESCQFIGAKIRLNSIKNEGSTFYVTLPNKLSTTEKEKKNEQASASCFNILIVEDEDTNFLLLEALIEEFYPNSKTIHARDGKQAIDICLTNNKIDLILMDMKMPIMNGLEATKKIKKLYNDLPIIAQTAYSNTEDKEKVKESGCDEFVSKPINEKHLKHVLEKYLVKNNKS